MDKQDKKKIIDSLEGKKMDKIRLVTYPAFGTIEGFVENEKDFDKWLKKHNTERKQNGELEERKEEFKLEEVGSIWNIR